MDQGSVASCQCILAIDPWLMYVNPIYHRTNNKQQLYLNKLLDISRIIPYTWTVAGDGG